jgi:Na+-translocating ferredoxin:NAD+ oxidoreductase RnfC subunit
MKLTTIIASATTAAVLGTVGVSVAGATGGGGSTPTPAVTAAATSRAARGLRVAVVRLPLKMHLGASSVPVVKPGETVKKGQLIADIPEGKLGAKLHASIDGTVNGVTEQYIEIRA